MMALKKYSISIHYMNCNGHIKACNGHNKACNQCNDHIKNVKNVMVLTKDW